MKRLRLFLALLWVLSTGLAIPKVEFTRLTLAGRNVQSIKLYGAEYASQVTMSGLLSIQRDGQVVRIQGLGHTMLLPIDMDQLRATTDFNTVQLDTKRVQARTATWVNGNLYLPLDTIARGLGAKYKPGSFTVGLPTLNSVSSRAGKTSDRLVLDLNRDVEVVDEIRGTQLRVILKNTKGEVKRYATRGAFVPSVQVNREGNNTVLSLTMPQNSGYRVYPVVRPGGARIVIDVGPGIPGSFPAIMERIGKPLIVIDPEKIEGMGKDVTLEVARRAAQMLNKAGWQVKLTRSNNRILKVNEKQYLARQSDVYLVITMGKFPNSARNGVTVYEHVGASPSVFIRNIRKGTNKPPFASLAVGNTGGTKRLAELMRGELKTGGITARKESMQGLIVLNEAPQASLMLEVGWLGNAQDRANLATDEHVQALSVGVARSVATYLTARANNASRVNGASGSER